MIMRPAPLPRPSCQQLFGYAAEESGPRTDWRPVTLDAGDIGKSITGDPGTVRFSVGGIAFKPFYETYGQYSVYLNVTLK
jgi:hypothetical protein